ncbi:hypothetical protein H310_09989 [Aphanomyces invadans]|uniref:Metallo-beta-lactamase domain-containing protein n=1 Tax=Aphanomyces invadans TaxID=157072 RepID=A0A024TSS1_9STRA|nr:hypothetical protein H310_09989 [Aphanomyces invadans]ETV97200.1 hypothetical protein H310_09989 [Aphanomyces invadans]|eukprot:XP_008874446.1 hypothetical protein H310_09989 [Aphanomyces invadans]
MLPAIRDASGRFPVTASGPRFLDLVKWWLTAKEETGPRVPKDAAELDRSLPVLTPDFTVPIDAGHARLTWLGHASVLLEVPVPGRDRPFVILTDPVFTDRCSPSQYFGPKRYRPAPVPVANLPPVDIVLISHNHYDHLEEVTLAQLYAVQPNISYFTPVGNAKWIASAGVPLANIHEQNWWDVSPATTETETLPFEVGCVPANHWSKRGFFDRNMALWGGFVVRGLGGSFYFAGDTATGSIFQAIGHRYGDQSVSAIPIGAYSPRHLFRDHHCDVAEAIQIHHHVKSRASIGVHWGTWVLTGEYYLEPKQELHAQMAATDRPDAFTTVDHGQSKLVQWVLDDACTS